MIDCRNSRRLGITLPEVMVVLAILFFGLMIVLAALPRRREVARSVGCQRNLMQIGIALAQYDQSERRLPTVPRLGTDSAATGGPLKAVLEAFTVSDLTRMSLDPRSPPPQTGPVPTGGRVPGFVCPADRSETGLTSFAAPVSYRATAGDDPEGSNGGFAPGVALRRSDIESADGQSYTAAFSERLLGDLMPKSARYHEVNGPIVVTQGCPTGSPGTRTDAGWSWVEASWRSTLYNHASLPDATRSCVSTDGTAALIGASSVHPGGVNVLNFDGSVRIVTPSVAPNVWKALATWKSAESDENTQ